MEPAHSDPRLSKDLPHGVGVYQRKRPVTLYIVAFAALALAVLITLLALRRG